MLRVQLIRVLVVRHVEGAGRTGELHVELHLAIVPKFRLLHAVRDQLLKARLIVRLELEQVLVVQAIGHHPLRHAVGVPAQVPFLVAKRPLLAGLRIHPVDFQPHGLEVIQHAGLFAMAGLEQAQHATVEGLGCSGPPKGIPERPVAFRPECGHPQIGAFRPVGSCLVVLIDGIDQSSAPYWDLGHYSISFTALVVMRVESDEMK